MSGSIEQGIKSFNFFDLQNNNDAADKKEIDDLVEKCIKIAKSRDEATDFEEISSFYLKLESGSKTQRRSNIDYFIGLIKEKYEDKTINIDQLHKINRTLFSCYINKHSSEIMDKAFANGEPNITNSLGAGELNLQLLVFEAKKNGYSVDVKEDNGKLTIHSNKQFPYVVLEHLMLTHVQKNDKYEFLVDHLANISLTHVHNNAKNKVDSLPQEMLLNGYKSQISQINKRFVKEAIENHRQDKDLYNRLLKSYKEYLISESEKFLFDGQESVIQESIVQTFQSLTGSSVEQAHQTSDLRQSTDLTKNFAAILAINALKGSDRSSQDPDAVEEYSECSLNNAEAQNFSTDYLSNKNNQSKDTMTTEQLIKYATAAFNIIMNIILDNKLLGSVYDKIKSHKKNENKDSSVNEDLVTHNISKANFGAKIALILDLVKSDLHVVLDVAITYCNLSDINEKLMKDLLSQGHKIQRVSEYFSAIFIKPLEITTQLTTNFQNLQKNQHIGYDR